MLIYFLPPQLFLPGSPRTHKPQNENWRVVDVPVWSTAPPPSIHNFYPVMSFTETLFGWAVNICKTWSDRFKMPQYRWTAWKVSNSNTLRNFLSKNLFLQNSVYFSVAMFLYVRLQFSPSWLCFYQKIVKKSPCFRGQVTSFCITCMLAFLALLKTFLNTETPSQTTCLGSGSLF